MESYKFYFSNKKFVWSFILGNIFLGTSLFVQYTASNYSTRVSSNHVTDIILSNIRVYDVDALFVWGAVLLLVAGIYLAVKNINYAPFMMKSIALFTIIRSIFVSLTHISPFPTQATISSTFFQHSWFNGIFNGNDLFFSGHTGVPFLLALIFWDNKKLRYMFLGFSLVLGTVVLLGHFHYSIDVFAAYFITFSIFSICKFLFKKDLETFREKR